VTNFNAEAEGITPDSIIRRLVEQIPVAQAGSTTEQAALPPVFRN
jgi:hypothetical protein